jgi:hypothetical protein
MAPDTTALVGLVATGGLFRYLVSLWPYSGKPPGTCVPGCASVSTGTYVWRWVDFVSHCRFREATHVRGL